MRQVEKKKLQKKKYTLKYVQVTHKRPGRRNQPGKEKQK